MWLVPVVYTSVGFAGGSAFVAVLLLLGYSSRDASFYGLVFNTLSASTSLIRWRLHLDRGLAWYIVGAVPLAYIGGQVRISDEALRLIMAAAIILSGIAALVTSAQSKSRSIHAILRLLVGGVIGFLSGMTGIGGGVYLSSFLVFSGDALPKQTAATTTLFIMLNSLSGLFGKAVVGNVPTGLDRLILVVFPLIVLGAAVGSYLGSKKLGESSLKKLLGVVLIAIGVSILLLGQ